MSKWNFFYLDIKSNNCYIAIQAKSFLYKVFDVNIFNLLTLGHVCIRTVGFHVPVLLLTRGRVVIGFSPACLHPQPLLTLSPHTARLPCLDSPSGPPAFQQVSWRGFLEHSAFGLLLSEDSLWLRTWFQCRLPREAIKSYAWDLSAAFPSCSLAHHSVLYSTYTICNNLVH